MDTTTLGYPLDMVYLPTTAQPQDLLYQPPNTGCEGTSTDTMVDGMVGLYTHVTMGWMVGYMDTTFGTYHTSCVPPQHV